MKDADKKNFYCLDMFPYPSGSGLHVGHPRGYTATDVYSRFKKLQGFNVIHPMGWDAFGLPAENYAIKNKTHPSKVVEENVAHFKSQLEKFDLSYDWEKEVNTTDPKYYRWTQFIFLKLFERGLAYEAEVPINYCPSCKTGLANEEVVGGKCERCGTAVERKNIRQWILKITEYADRLLEDLDGLDWPEPIKEMQKNWIGRSEGSNIRFELKAKSEKRKAVESLSDDYFIEVYTTRADTLYGCTWVVLAPEHILVDKLKVESENQEEINEYIQKSKNKSDLERTELQKEKTGVELKGIKAINPINGKEVAVWVADYVLGHYGTGAVMAVPAHDERDFEFAKKYDIDIIQTIAPQVTYYKTPPKDGLPYVERNSIEVIVRDPKTDKYLCLEWKNQPWTTFVTGGVDDGEDYLSAAKREFLEETGYKNIKLIKSLGRTRAVFHAAHKNENRVGNMEGFLFELVDDERNDMSSDEKAIHEVIWLSRDELKIERIVCASFEYWMRGIDDKRKAIEDYGYLVNSEEFNGLSSADAKKKITEKLKESGHGDFTVNYKLRDWVFSRQRYWGEPIPIVHCEKCGIVAVPETDLPVLLPHVEKYEPTGDGTSPLSNESDPAIAAWLNTTCPECGGKAKRETNTMPQWAGSCWYYIAYLMKTGDEYVWDRDKIDPWLPVNLYVGGAEHAVLHLLYSRFWHKVLYDEKLVGSIEPFQKLISVGTILGIDGVKMSKSRGNVIDPDPLIEKFGSDALKMYELYIGPFSQPAKWSQNGIVGMHRFLQKVEKISDAEISESNSKNLVPINKAIKKVAGDIESFSFNTAISTLIETFDLISTNSWDKPSAEIFLTLLSPFAPKMAEQVSQKIGIQIPIWPEFDPKYIADDKVTIAIQINGKVRDQIEIAIDEPEEKVKELVLEREKIKSWILEAKIKKFIYVPGKIISIVV